MTCGRCRGLMIRHVEVRVRWTCWRCTACGDRLDPVIERHRRSSLIFNRSNPKQLAEALFQQLLNSA